MREVENVTLDRTHFSGLFQLIYRVLETWITEKL